MKGEGSEDVVHVRGDVSGDEETLEEGFLQHVFGLVGVLRHDGFIPGNNLLVNLDINDLGWLVDDLSLSGDGFNNDLLVSWGNLDISSDLGNFSNNGLVDEEGPVDFVQEEFVVDSLVHSVLVTSEDWGVGVTICVGRVGGAVNSMSKDPVHVISNSDFTLVARVGVGVEVV